MSLSSLMVPDQPVWTGAMSAFPFTAKMQAKFSLTSRFGEEYKLWRPAGDKILIPRAVAPIGKEDLRVIGVPANFDKCVFKPRDDHQLRAVMAARGNLTEGRSFIFQAPTGKGKTAMAMPLIASVGRMTLVVVPKEDLLDRWCEDLVNILGLTTKEIGIMQADQFAFSGKKVVVGMLQSLSKLQKYPAWVKQELGFIIFDEVHRLGADHFMQVAGAYPSKLRLGLSAQPERKDGRELAFQSHIGANLVSIDIEEMVPKVLKVESGFTMPRDRTGSKLDHSPAGDAHIRRILFKNRNRNALITRAIMATQKKGRKIIVFSDYIDHLDLLYQAAQEAGLPEWRMGKYIGTGISKADLDKALGRDVIFATYGKMAEGTNVPWIDTCLLAGPRSDVLQPVGRIRREYEDKFPPIVIDIVDSDSWVYNAYSKSRDSWYKSIGAEIMKGTF